MVTGTVSGMVTDAQTGLSVALASVYIPGSKVSGMSRPDGRYELQNVPAGTYTLTVRRTGYRDTEMPIRVDSGLILEQNAQAVPLPSRFLEAMKELERATELSQPVEVRVIRER